MRDEYRGSPILGARRFHKWATSQLRPEVREHYGEQFVLATHRLLADFPANPTSPTRRGFCRFSVFSATQVIELLESGARNQPQSCL